MIHYILNYEGGKSIDFHALRSVSSLESAVLAFYARGSSNFIAAHLVFGAQDRGIQFAAENENGGDHVEKNECDHDRRETRVGGDIIAREFGEVGAEGNA